jgi:arylsulfatase A-like enzyme
MKFVSILPHRHPTCCSGLALPKTIQGKSLLPLITGQKEEIRTSALVEYFSNEQPFPWTAQLDYRVIIKDQFKYIKWLRFDEAELYDLNSDPYEMNNLIGNPAYAETIDKLKTELQKLQLEALGLD